jgi:hypothetical protein
LQPVLASPFFRGGVSGIGFLTVLAGVAELTGLLMRRRKLAEIRSPDSGESAP